MKSHTGGIYEGALCNSVRHMSERLNDLIDKTTDIGKEITVAWCVSAPDINADPNIDPDPLIPYETNYVSSITDVGDIIIGEEKEVTPEEMECGENVASAGFHTHPNNDIRLSPADYANSFILGRHINCIGVRNKDNNNVINCDIMLPGHDKYEEYGKEIIDMNDTKCEIATEDFLQAVENGLPADQVEAKHDTYIEMYYDMLQVVDSAMSAGVMRRCSLISNLSKINKDLTN